jgi:hypothetical protein
MESGDGPEHGFATVLFFSHVIWLMSYALPKLRSVVTIRLQESKGEKSLS